MGSINHEIIKHFVLRVFPGLSMSPAVSAVNDRDYCFFPLHPSIHISFFFLPSGIRAAATKTYQNFVMRIAGTHASARNGCYTARFFAFVVWI